MRLDLHPEADGEGLVVEEGGGGVGSDVEEALESSVAVLQGREQGGGEGVQNAQTHSDVRAVQDEAEPTEKCSKQSSKGKAELSTDHDGLFIGGDDQLDCLLGGEHPELE